MESDEIHLGWWTKGQVLIPKRRTVTVRNFKLRLSSRDVGFWANPTKPVGQVACLTVVLFRRPVTLCGFRAKFDQRSFLAVYPIGRFVTIPVQDTTPARLYVSWGLLDRATVTR